MPPVVAGEVPGTSGTGRSCPGSTVSTGGTPAAPGAAASAGWGTGATPAAPGAAGCAEGVAGSGTGTTPAAPGAAGCAGGVAGSPAAAAGVGDAAPAPAAAGGTFGGNVVKTGASRSAVSSSTNAVRSPGDGRLSPGVLSGGASPSTGGGLIAIVATRYFDVRKSRLGGRTAPGATVAAKTSILSSATGAGPFTFVDGTLKRRWASLPIRPIVMFAGATGTMCRGASGGPLRPHAAAHAATARTSSRRRMRIRGCSATSRCCRRCRRACVRRTRRRW